MAKKKTSTSKKKKTPRKKISFALSKQQKILLGSFLFFLGLALIFSFVSYFFSWQTDQSIVGLIEERELQAENWLNKFGNNVAHFFVYDGFGIAAFIFAFLVTLTGIYYFFDYAKKQLLRFWFWGLLVMLWISVFFGFFAGTRNLFSGVMGYEINDFLQDYLGLIGTILLMTFLAIVYLVIRLKMTPEKVGDAIKKTKKDIADDFNTDPASEENSENLAQQTDYEKQVIEEVVNIDDTGSIDLETIVDEDNLEEPFLKTVIQNEIKDSTDSEVAMEIEKAAEEETVEENISKKLVEDFGEFDPTLELSNYKFPK